MDLDLETFGTVVRHRSKFVIMLIVLAAPKLKKYSFKKNKLIWNKN